MSEKVRKLKDQAVRHVAHGNFQRALDALQQVLAIEPRDLQSRQKCGDLHRKLGRSDLALEAYQAVAGAYAAEGLLLKAIAVCRVILQIDPEHKETQETLADLYAKKRRPMTEAELPASMSTALADVKKRSAAGIRGRPLSQIHLARVEPPAEEEDVLDAWSLASNTGFDIDVVEPDEDASLELSVGDDEVVETTTAPVEVGDQEIMTESTAGIEEPAALEVDLDDIEVEATTFVDLGALPSIPLFSDLSKNAFVALLEKLETHAITDGGIVVREGDPGDSFFVIASGKVRVIKEREVQEATDLAYLGEGSFFGEMAVLGEGVRMATVIADGTAELLEIKKSVLDELIKSYPSVKQVLSRFHRTRLLANLLKTSPLFAPFGGEMRRSLIEKFKSRELKRGTRILEEGQKGDGLYLLLSGQCEVSKKRGGQKIVLADLREGGLFGEMSLLTGRPVTATVTTKRRSLVLRLPRRSFSEVIMTYPQLLEHVNAVSDARAADNATLLDAPGTSDEDVLV